MNLIFLNGTFKLFALSNGDTYDLSKELSCDQSIFMCSLLGITTDLAIVGDAANYITSCIIDANGKLGDIQNVRLLFYESARQWSQDNLKEPIRLLELREGISSNELIEALSMIAKCVRDSNSGVKSFFLGHVLNDETMIPAIVQGLWTLATEINSLGILYRKVLAFLIGAVMDRQPNSMLIHPIGEIPDYLMNL
jgi:hypothetical protein